MRYLIFGGTAFYAAGGARDLIETADSLEVAEKFAGGIIGATAIIANKDDEDSSCKIEWSHVLDLETKTIVAKFGARPYGRSWDGDMVTALRLYEPAL